MKKAWVRKIKFSVFVLFFLCIPVLAIYDSYFVGNCVCDEPANWRWDCVNNWWDNIADTNGLPLPSDDTRLERNNFNPCIAPDDPGCVLIESDMNIQVGQLLGGWESGPVCVTMNGGYFNPGYLEFGGSGDETAVATFNMNGGVLDVKYGNPPINGMMILGEAQTNLPEYKGQGIFNLYDGTVNIAWALWLASPDPASPDPNTGTRGVMNLYGGTVNANGPLLINPCDGYGGNGYVPYPLEYGPGISGRVNIEEGVLRFAGFGPVTGPSAVEFYVRDGRITAYDGHPRAQVRWEFDPDLYKTVVWATIDGDFNTPWSPYPEDGSTDQFRYALLSWMPGDDAVQHDVYFGTDPNDVDAATVAVPLGVYQGRQSLELTSFDPGFMDLGQTYYWRIDEVNASSVITKGPVWSFTVTSDYILEHFEGYFEITDANNIWVPSGGATLDLNTDDLTVYAGRRALIMVYDNTIPPYYSQAGVVLPRAVDLTLGSSALIRVNFHGNDGNAQDPFYIQLEDADGAMTPKIFYPGDLADLAEEGWRPWSKQFNVGFADLTGVDITRIEKIYIGLGNGISAGGTGTVQFDDIVVLPPSCVESFAGDFDNDCDVDFADYSELAADYGLFEFDVIPQNPPAGSLKLWYTFDQASGTSVTDNSGNGKTGTVVGPPIGIWETGGGKISGCIKLNLNPGISVTQAVKIPVSTWTSFTDQVTVAVWVKGDPMYQPPAAGTSQYIFNFGYNATGFVPIDMISAQCPEYDGDVSFTAGSPDGPAPDGVSYRPDSSDAWINQWNHYAFTKNASTGIQRIYRNGIMVAELTGSTDLIDDIDTGMADFQVIGGGYALSPGWGGYKGRLDDFRIYNVALTQAQIASVLSYAPGTTVHQPAPQTDLGANGTVDFDDLVRLAEKWTLISLFP